MPVTSLNAKKGFALKHLSAVKAKLSGIVEYQGYFMACCPAHDDTNPSLLVRTGKRRFWPDCKAGCPPDEIARALELTAKHQRGKHERHPNSKKVDTYLYQDLNSKVLFEKHRFEPGGDGKKKKDFLYSHTTSDGKWAPGQGPAEPVPYCLGSMLYQAKQNPNQSIIIVEGEKAVRWLRIGKLNATCFAASGEYRPSYDEYFRGRKVIIVPDNDKKGMEAANMVAARLHGVASVVIILELPGTKPKDGMDDWIRANLNDWRLQLRELVKGAAPFEPTAQQHEPLNDNTPDVESDEPRSTRQGGQQSADDKYSYKFGLICDTPASNDGPPRRSFEDLDTTVIGDAEFFDYMHRDIAMYCGPWKKWLIWDGTRWRIDECGVVMRLATQTAIETYSQGEDEAASLAAEDDEEEEVQSNPGMRLANKPSMESMLKLAQSLMPITVEDMDQNEYLLNCPNGTVDLRTGELHEHERWRNITKLCPTEYHPEAPAAAWDRFLKEVFVDKELISFVQQLLGYCLTADVSEQKLPIFCGSGANGKSTLLNAFMDVVGTDYSMQAMPELLMEKRNESHPTEKAALFGKRFVSCVETEASRKLSESTVKMLTGGERIQARRMREDFWEFAPSHKLVLCTNHKPVVAGTDHGIWRRMLLIPFTQMFEGSRIDKALPEKLRAEAQGILAWLVRGCIEWKKHGLNPPAVVTDATKEYRSQEDVIGRFIEECCQPVKSGSIKFSNLYYKFEVWAEDAGEYRCEKKSFGTWLADHGYKKHRSNGVWYRGLMLKE